MTAGLVLMLLGGLLASGDAAKDLDATLFRSGIAISPDGRVACLALALGLLAGVTVLSQALETAVQ